MREAAGTSPYGASVWFNQGCTIGCPECKGVEDASGSCGSQQGEATLPSSFFTYDVDKKSCGINPWCAPGSSPMMNPCGLAGGDVQQGKAGNGGDAPPGYNLGAKGTEMRDGAVGIHRTWVAGDVAEVSWAIIANHGGGYQYRLCPKDGDQSEECFQQTPLEFVGDTQQIQYCDLPKEGDHGENAMNRTATPDGFNGSIKILPSDWAAKLGGCDNKARDTIPAMRINTGTVPSGSTWTRNPIPACKNIAGGAFNMGCHVSSIEGKYSTPKATDFEFAPVGVDKSRDPLLLGGFGLGACFGCNQVDNPADCDKYGKFGRNNCTVDEVNGQSFSFNVLDTVRVPQVPAGDYVVSFRWDCEQTPQIWSQCSDVTIVVPAATSV